MKIKTLSILATIAILAVIIVSNSLGSDETKPKTRTNKEVHLVNNNEHHKKIKEIISKPVEENTIPMAKAVSKEKLMGHLNKEYGIREDILRYIEREVPDNEMAKKAAIKYAQKWNFIYYKATQEEAIKEANQQLITLDCLRLALKTDERMAISRGISELMRNTPERDKYLWDISSKYFGGKAFGNEPISDDELKRICESGDY